MRCIRLYWATVFAFLLAEPGQLAAQALIGNFTSHTDGQSVASPSISITWTGCSNTTQSSYQTRVNGNLLATTQSNGLPCPDYSIGKNYSASATLVNGANLLYLQVCDLSDCGESTITVNYLAPAAVTVTPDGATAPPLPHRTSGSYNFKVRNTGGYAATATFTYSCPAPLGSCSVAPGSAFLAPGDSTMAALSYTGAAVGSGQATLTATYVEHPSVTDNGVVNVEVTENPIWGVTVTPQNPSQTVTAGTTVQIRFDVANTSQYTSASSDFALAIESPTSGISCPGPLASLTLSPGDPPSPVTVTCNISSSATNGSVKLTASTTSPATFNGYGSTDVIVSPTNSLSLTAANSKTEPNRTTADTVIFTVTNNSQNSGSMLVSFEQECTGVVTCGVDELIPSVSIPQGESRLVSFPYDVSLTGTTGEISLKATSGALSQTKVVSILTTPDYAVNVTPEPSAITVPAGTRSTLYTIQNTSANTPGPVTFTLTAACHGVATCVTAQGTTNLAQGASSNKSVSFEMSSAGTFAVVMLIASPVSPNFPADTGATTVTRTTAVSYGVRVTPASSSVTLPAQTARDSIVFTVQNTSTNTSDAIGYTLESTCTGIASCTSLQGAIVLDEGASGTKTVVYDVSLTGDTGSVSLKAFSTSPSVPSSTGTTRVNATPRYAISVLPATGSATVGAGTTNTYSVITIKNNSTNSANPITVSVLSPSCSGVTVGNCSVPANSAVIAQGEETPSRTLTYSALAANATPETIALDASGTVSGGTVLVTNASLNVTVSSAAGTIVISGKNPGTTVDRRGCLTVAAGQNAAYECGDLRVVHELPATVTMDRARGPALIYNSRHASPGALVAADVTYSGPAPTILKATVAMAGQTNIVRDIAWSSACSAKACRIVVPISTTQPTGLYPVTLQVTAMNGATTYATSTTVSDTVIVVNRSSSPYGAGWWVDGLESLATLSPTRMLWIGGDGSARVYTQTADANVYTVGPSYDRPDTLRKVQSGAAWRRALGDSAYVEFTSAGQHVKTVNSLGWETKFLYTGTQLDSLVLPVPAGSGTVRRYRFLYTSGLIDSVQAPTASFSRTTRMTRGGTSRINSITDPDGLATSFGYDASNRIITRRNKLADTTYFDYDGGGALRQSRLSTARTDGPNSAITTTFRAAETRSVFDGSDLPTLLDRAFTKLDGPRTDVGDTTSVFVNRWGAPDSVCNAMGQRTRISRANASFPALATKVIAPNGFETRAFFNARGLTDSTVAVNPYGTGNAKTTFIWNPLWNRVDSVIDPTGRRTRTFYKSTRPLVDSVRTGTNTQRRVKFAYTADNQLRSVTEAGGLPDSVLYDALGNATKTWTPLGRSASSPYFTQLIKDAIGRDTLVIQPISGDTTGSTRIMYDVADRVIRTVSSGPVRPYTLPLSGFARDTATISVLSKTDSSGYDAEGNLVYKRSLSSPSSDAGVNESMVYDAAGRLRKRMIGTGPDSMVYDPAGNLISARHRSGSWVTQSYDVLNRLATRVVPSVVYPRERCTKFSTGPISGPANQCLIVFPYYPNAGDSLRIPADTSRFVYDAVSGDMRQANNRYARVRRTYHPGGALKTDTIVFGQYSAPLTDGTMRGQQYAYDLAGRRTWMDWYFGANTYAYNDFGALDSLISQHADVYRMKYDLKGQIDSLILGTGVRESRVYDADGRMTSRNRISTYGTLGTLVSDVFAYDKMNRVISVSEQVGQQGAEQTLISYDGLGAVQAKEQSIAAGGARAEEFRNDAFGNVIRRRTRRTAGLINDAPFINQYSVIGELTNSFAQLSNPVGQNEREDQLKQEFAAGGQLAYQDQIVRVPNGAVTLQLAGRHYYGADDKVMAVQRYSYRSPTVRDGTWEEYWYDALGRRVLTRARRDPAAIYSATFAGPLCMGTNVCRSFTERVSWDGDQALVEDRVAEGTSDVSNNGVIRNIHGPMLDEPLAVVADAIRIINYNWRGQGMSSVFLNGSAGDISLGNTATEVDWPAVTQAEAYFAASPDANPSTNPKRWLGTFVANGQGTTGMLYRRNRYFEPKSGQFTQADPTGIATGMNVFGFAAGDPINFSDPFGLCSPWPECSLQSAANWGAQRGGTSGSAILNAAAAANAAAEALSINDLGRAIANRDMVSGAVALASMLPMGKAGKIGKVAREFEGGSLAADEALRAAERWLGAGYREISSGVFRSADRARQFRMTAHDLVKDVRKGPHVHFEAIAADGKEILENTWVRIKQ